MTAAQRRADFHDWFNKKTAGNKMKGYWSKKGKFKHEDEVTAEAVILFGVTDFFDITDATWIDRLIEWCDANNILKLTGEPVGEGVKGIVCSILKYYKKYLGEEGAIDGEEPEFDEGEGVGEDSEYPDAPSLPLNLILYGPPGTGKTYHTIEKAVEIIDGINPSRTHEDAKERFDELKGKGQIVFTTFHQSMSYEDFIEGIKPVLDGTSIGYKIQPGIFKEISEEALFTHPRKYVLIIDEINRGNVANIFGELITLIEEDKRLGNSEQMTCTLPYSKEQFGVPNNLYIIGTMNTADRSVEALDTALRRRFTFEEMMPKPELLKETDDGINLTDFLNVINKRISLLKDREHQIGHSYFMKVASKETLIDVIFKNVIPLLQEYFYGDYEKIQMVLGETFIPEDDTLKVDFAASSGSYEPEKVYRIAGKDGIKIDDALESIKFGYKKASSKKTEETPEDAE